MGLLLVRYAEMGLKSPGIRRYFEKVLIHNMMAALANDHLEAFIESQYGRIFVTTDRPEETSAVLRRVFGVSSLSHVQQCVSSIPEMRKLALEVATPLLKDGSSFRVEARRNGTHPYTSMQLAAQAGEEIYEANRHRGVHVDLHHPELVIYVEVRDRRAYVFSEYIDGPGGLPMGSQGKVVALIDNKRDALAAWMMMKRGCRALFLVQDEESMRILERWDPEPRRVTGTPGKLAYVNKAQGIVVGWSLDDIVRAQEMNVDVPIYHPLIGMDDAEVERRLREISS
ncbi:MAG: THUMP domain-containing protein [Methanomassiliicoccales archaeon]|nr:THUMP domain-containing protein [Methanomassiliicoccales archaeon]